ncbi:MAG: hypothetical protein ACJAQT_004355 [Akkermansiaceae bacterium]|jgi:hypothetical protein
MSNSICTSAGVLTASLLTFQSATAQIEDWFMDKGVIYRQSEDDTAPIEAEKWGVEIGVTTTSITDAGSVTISRDGDATIHSFDYDDGEWVYEDVFASEEAVNTAFPSGQNYTLTLSGGTLGTLTQTFNLGPANYPDIPYFTGSDFGASQNINPNSTFRFHWNSPGTNATGGSLEIEDPVSEDEVTDFKFDVPLQTSEFLNLEFLNPGHLYSGYLSFLNTTTHSGGGGFGVAGYIEHSTNLSFDCYLLQAAAPKAIVGAWQFGDSSTQDSGLLVFQENGTYFHVEDPAPGSHGNAGVEMGTYSLDESGALTVETLIDTNGDIGLSHPSGSDTFSVEGNTLTITDNEESFALSRVEFDPANPIVGAWRLINNSSDDTAVVVFLNNGYYFHGEATNPDPTGEDGMERGTYTLNNGVLTATPITDTNGEWGLSDPIIGFDDLTITDKVAMRLYDGEVFHLRRISNASVLPDWRINKARNYNQTAANTAPTTPIFWDLWALVETRNPNDIGSVTMSGGGLASPLSFFNEGEGEWTYEKDYSAQAALDADFPDNGTFTITVSGGALGTRVQTININSAAFPPVPYLTGALFDEARSLDPADDFSFVWNDPMGSATHLVISSETNEGGEEYFSEKSLIGSTTIATVPANSIPDNILCYGYLEFGRGATNVGNTGGFGVSGFSSRNSITLDFIIDTRPGDDGGLNDAAATAGLTGADALPNATPFNDGIDNLVKFAFNMDLSKFDNGSLEPGGNSGLPTFALKDEDGENSFEIEFIRRVGSSLTYTAQRSDSLDGFTAMTGAVAVTPIAGGEFERVSVSESCDPSVVPRCFGRVLVSAP